MAAAWLRIDELINSCADVVCIVARIQSINLTQNILIVHDNDEEKQTSTSSMLNISLTNLRTSMTIQSSILCPGQYIQIYGKFIRQGDDHIRIDAQFIRPLGMNFDMNKYIQGLTLTRIYMNDVDGNNENLVDNNGNPIRTIL